MPKTADPTTVPPGAPPIETSSAALAFADLREQAELIARREVSSRELVEIHLARILAAQPTLNAFRVVCIDQAREEAAAADERVARGETAPLLGVPVAIKDDVDFTGHTSPFGCDSDFPVAEEDAEAVRRLRAAGAVVLGKTTTPEVGQWHFTETLAHGATRNPWNLEHTPGGSSGGAGAAVAAGLAAAAMGSDGAGSIRIPASWNGLVGLKPQRGRISTMPEPESFNGLSCYGPLTRSVADAALMLDVLSGNAPGDRHRVDPPEASFVELTERDPGRLRIALSFATPFGVPDKVHPDHRRAIEDFARRLEDLGHTVEPADPSYGLVGLSLIPRGMAGVNAWLRANVADRSRLEPRTHTHARFGRLLSGPPLRAARAAEPGLRRRIGSIFDRFDLILTPTTAKPPPQVGSLAGQGYWASSTAASAACPFAWAWNVTGWPGISLPAGRTTAGLPIGAQLLGPASSEATLLALGRQMEKAGQLAT